ncbi:hypothetical protein EY643_09725 [Halioglobus maricola]|uniref:Rap1a immunity protein domain-containing protein n=1 Tax=Halioglobus maricola TaxID=2601894 RepID=A0A5P9NLX2_9GAMM|nr:Rap1a/Tai family immunity protein [Halioglobus maricola]QFU75918.1 hypothetical protein EY643_09725 [Halioglobus maricola]
MSELINARPSSRVAFLLPLLLAMSFANSSRALEVLTVHELVAHCTFLQSDPEGADGQYCTRYIQGFIDGAVETDARIAKEVVTGSADSLTERAKRTRMPRRDMYDRPGSLAGFCLGDPLPLRQVVDTVVNDLVVLDIDETAESPARIAVDDSLRQHYPCSE